MTKSVVCVMGLGFVGAAMAVACAQAGVRRSGDAHFDVVGLDLPTPSGIDRISAINQGVFPFETTDTELVREAREAWDGGRLTATSDVSVLERADVVVVDVHLDILDIDGPSPTIVLKPFESAIRSIGERLRPGALVVVETTVPPGTCKTIVRPILDDCAVRRGYGAGAFLLAHAYERVMPGANYLASITDFWRVYSGDTEPAASACRDFLEKVVNTEKFPLACLGSTTASETAKVLENSYRAMNIAFIDEWGHFAEKAGFDLFEVIDAIRMRPTHSNIRQPGFGVGGYCLTKDPLFAALACKSFLEIDDIDFPMSRMAVQINQQMPLWSVERVRHALGSISGKKILLAGVSYRQDVADTRYSPSETFFEAATKAGAQVECYDPLVDVWPETNVAVVRQLSICPEVDVVVFAVPHGEFRKIDPVAWLGNTRRPLILDANDCLTKHQRAQFRTIGCRVECVGRGNV